MIFPELIIRLLRRRLLPEGERRQRHLPGSGLPGWRRAIAHEHGCAGRNAKDVQAGGIDWAEVRRVYEAGEVPLSAVYQRFGLTRARLRRAYVGGGWQRRPQVAQPGVSQGLGASEPERTARRLMRVLSAQMKELPDGSGSGETGRAGARAPEELRALAEMARALEGVMREDRLRKQAGPDGAGRNSSTKPAAGGGHSETDDDAAHVEWMRSEFKRRIAVLRRSAGLGREGGQHGDGDD